MRVIVFACIALLPWSFAGCFENQRGSNVEDSVSTKKTSTTGSGVSVATTCFVFTNNSRDYQLCQACISSLGVYASENQIVQCVHDNVTAGVSAGQCSIPVCGPGQIVDLAACLCKDAATAATTIVTPGQDDTLSPYLEAGFHISNRYCAPPIAGTNTDKAKCMRHPGLSTTDAPIEFPRHTTFPPANILQDIGYIRWDLSIDASQFDVASVLEAGLPFIGTNSTFPGTFSFYYKLKPNTVLSTANATAVKWQDCVEHFSGVGATPASEIICGNRTTVTQTPVAGAQDIFSAPLLSDVGGTSGTAVYKYLPMNGGGANKNITDLSTGGNQAVDAGTLGFGKGKDYAGAVTSDSGLFSNIGNYKFSFGPLGVRRPGAVVTDIASNTVSGRVAVNTNLGYTPTSAVNSTAFSPDAVNRTIPTRTCTSSTYNPCVLTALYRSSGGNILYQSFAPRFSNNGASTIGSLPTGIKAVSTPKVIEDISQITGSDTSTPARLRAFVRATDGNIYMSRGEYGTWNQWINLGKPWTCNRSAGSTCAGYFTTPSTPQVYQPFSIQDAPYNSGVPGANDGISIAGEPVVASYMDNTAAATPIPGYIAVLVRVSHYNSSTGAPGFYHNAVFYTLAATDNTYTSGTTLDFDKPATWSRWMPVVDAADNLFRIQGNPTAVMKEVNNNVVLAVMGTQNTDLHPPVAPLTLPAPPADPTASPPGWAINRWFNYGNTLIYTSLDVTGSVPTFESSFSAAVANTITNALDWNNISSEATSAGRVFVSDWSLSDVDADEIRIYASEIFDLRPLPAATADLASNAEVAPQVAYQRRVRYYEYQFGNAAPFALTSMCNTTDGGQFPHLRFHGNITPVELNRAVNGTRGNPVDVNSNSNLMFLFGRTTCVDKSKCDTLNPTAGYAVVKKATYCPRAVAMTNTAGDATMYFSTYAMTTDATTATRTMLIPTLVTSDVVGYKSTALDISSSDVPVYLFTRDVNGKVFVGQFGSFANGSSGLSIFTFIPLGGFTN